MIALDELKKLPIGERIQIVEELTRPSTRRRATSANPRNGLGTHLAESWELVLEQIRSGRE